MAYTKITHGLVEQQYDDEGNCIKQRFIPLNDAPVDRRKHLSPPGEDEEPDDELIEDAAEITQLESIEKGCPFDMVQPLVRK